MKKVLIVGGKLQGVEIAYLCKKAGYYTFLIDKNEKTPAMDLADEYIVGDALDHMRMMDLIAKVDVVIPALEDMEVLSRLNQIHEVTDTPLIFDMEAYKISSSKERSNELFGRLSLPIPMKYPDCSFPVIAKPDGSSGSAGVCKFENQDEVDHFLGNEKSDTVIQEFVEGPSYSLEILSNGKEYICPQITEIIVDDDYDCKRVVAPARISLDVENQFKRIGGELFEALKIKGLFDIEVVLHNGVLKILEIDARFPSQTPISVFHSTGINMVKVLVEEEYSGAGFEKGDKVCLYQQIQVDRQEIAVLGEHIMSDCNGLQVIEDFFGADVGITDYVPGSETFKSIIIITEKTEERAYKKFEKVKQAILRNVSLREMAV